MHRRPQLGERVRGQLDGGGEARLGRRRVGLDDRDGGDGRGRIGLRRELGGDRRGGLLGARARLGLAAVRGARQRRGGGDRRLALDLRGDRDGGAAAPGCAAPPRGRGVAGADGERGVAAASAGGAAAAGRELSSRSIRASSALTVGS